MQITAQQRHTQTIHVHHPHPSSQKRTALTKPWQTAKLARSAWVLPAVCLRFKPKPGWSWSASSNNQSVWHKPIKKRGCFLPLAMSQKHPASLRAPGQYPGCFLILRAGWNCSIRCQNTFPLNTLYTVLCAHFHSVLVTCTSSSFFLSAVFFQRAAGWEQRNGDDRGWQRRWKTDI